MRETNAQDPGRGQEHSVVDVPGQSSSSVAKGVSSTLTGHGTDTPSLGYLNGG